MKYNINDNTGIAMWEHIIIIYSMDNELSKPLPQITQTQYVQNASQYEETLTPKYLVKTIATVPTVPTVVDAVVKPQGNAHYGCHIHHLATYTYNGYGIPSPQNCMLGLG